MTRDFYCGKKVFVTGHTGFKGSWLCKILAARGASVMGYALEPQCGESLFRLAKTERDMESVIGDIRDREKLENALRGFSPEIVFHLAAQPIVREGYKLPAYTFETNTMGTVNILEAVKNTDCVRSFVNVTTDKVYKNSEWVWGYRETDELGGSDPYSGSKACSEIITECYKESFLKDRGIAVSAVRAGNVIGGGDFAADRIIPDCVRAASEKRKIFLRNPNSVRPYQHVLEALRAYLMTAEKQYSDASLADRYNVGPEGSDCISTGRLADIFCGYWGEGISCESAEEKNAPHEAGFLKLDSSKIRSRIGWQPLMNADDAVRLTVEWTKKYLNGEDMSLVTEKQISDYFERINGDV